MLVLLPPSEGKAAPARRGRPVDVAGLSWDDALGATRRRVLDALVAASVAPDALGRLGVGPSLADEVRRNTRLGATPARPALEVYTGVLYDALGWAGLDPAARRRGAARLVVVSALWGALRPGDRVPPYRLSMDTDLPGVGGVTAAWRAVLPQVLAEAAGRRGAVVDCRSSTYVAAAPLTGPLAARSVAVRVVREHEGRRSVVSHMAKHTRGLVARALVEEPSAPATPADVADLLATRWPVELTPPPRPAAPWTLTVLLAESGGATH